MSRHLAEHSLATLLEDEASAAERTHLQACAHCRDRLESARDGLDLARLAEVPEPPGLFWEAFPMQVERRLGTVERAVGPWRFAWLAAASAALAAFVAVTSTPGGEPSVSPDQLPVWSALPDQETDAGWAAVTGLAMEDAELDLLGECGLARRLLELSEEDSVGLADALREELEGRRL